MVEESEHNVPLNNESAEECLLRAQDLVPTALEKAKDVKGFSGKWKIIISKLDLIPSRLSDLSSHPFFSKNTLCIEQLQAVSNTLNEAIRLAELCLKEKFEGKLQMQSDLDSLIGKLDLNLRDCGLLIKTGVLGEVTLPFSPIATSSSSTEFESTTHSSVKELLARLQIGHLEAKHKALDSLVELMKEDEKSVLSVLGRSNVSALVQLLTATSPRIREKAVAVICSLAESGGCERWLVSEGVLPPLIRLVESGSPVGREKAAISLQRLSMSGDTARSIAGSGGVLPLIEACGLGDSGVAQSAAACTLKNISKIPEARQTLANEGAVGVMIDVLSFGISLGSKEYAAECLQNLTFSESLRREVVSGGGFESLLAYLDGRSPQESAVGAVRNLIPSVPTEILVSGNLIPRLVHVLRHGSLGAQTAAAAVVYCLTMDSEAHLKKLVLESGCVPLLVGMLGAETDGGRAAAARAVAAVVVMAAGRREVRRDGRSIPGLVRLLDPSEGNTAKKHAVACLVALVTSKRCRRLMVSYGAIGYLKKLSEMEISGAKKLLERLERGKLRSLFGGK